MRQFISGRLVLKLLLDLYSRYSVNLNNMEKYRIYQIILPQGKAKKPFVELTAAEQQEAARRIFEKVTEEAAKVGQLPVIRKYPKSEPREG